MNIYEQNRASNISNRLREYVDYHLKKYGIKNEDCLSNGEIYVMNETPETIRNSWIACEKRSCDFGVFYPNQKNLLRFYIQRNKIIGYYYKPSDSDEPVELIEGVTHEKSEVWTVPEYDTRFFMNALYINGELKGEYIFLLSQVDLFIDEEDYYDYIMEWNGENELLEEEVTGPSPDSGYEGSDQR